MACIFLLKLAGMEGVIMSDKIEFVMLKNINLQGMGDGASNIGCILSMDLSI